MGAEARLAELKLELPPAPKPVATYVTAIRHGDLLYVSGHGPLPFRRDVDHRQARGRPGRAGRSGRGAADRPGDPGDRASPPRLARQGRPADQECWAWSTATPDFADQPKVINGYLRPDEGRLRRRRASGRGAPSAWARCPAGSPSRSRRSFRSRIESAVPRTCRVPAGSTAALA